MSNLELPIDKNKRERITTHKKAIREAKDFIDFMQKQALDYDFETDEADEWVKHVVELLRLWVHNYELRKPELR